MRTGTDRTSGAIRWLYEWIVELYARYVLIRCSRFTNDRAVAEGMAACTLATTCLLAGELRHVGQLSLLADTMADVVGRDMARNDACASQETRPRAGPLLAEQQMQELAAALNRLDRSTREALILHHVEGMATVTLARLLRRPAPDLSAEILQGENTLAEQLAALRAPEGQTPGPDMRALLAALAVGLDVGFARPIGPWAFRYLLAAGPSLRSPHLIPCGGLRENT